MHAVPAFLFLCIFICIFSQNSHPRTWYVKEDGSGDAPTIQAAIDSSTAGDTVLVAPGVYSRIIIAIGSEKSNLVVLGEGGSEETILKESEYIIIDWVSQLIFAGFTISDSQGNGLYINLCTNISIEDNTFINSNRNAIVIKFSDHITVRNNLVYLSHRDGIYTTDCTESITIENNTIAYNTRDGMYLGDCGNYTVHNNIITQNETGVYSWCSNIIFSCNDVVGNVTNYELIFLPDPTGSNGNISYPIQFCGTSPQDSGNFYLQSDSPCAPGNNPDDPSCGLIGRYVVGCGTTSVEKTDWSTIKSMFK